MKNKIISKNIKDVPINNIEEYLIENNSEEYRLMGNRKKNFVRCLSEHFYDLINELRDNPKCSYDTYMNDVIKSGYTPKYLSIIKKEINPVIKCYDDFNLLHLRDVCASRILNYFECPTTYDVALNIGDKTYNCAVDFNRENEDFYMLNGIGGRNTLGYFLTHSLDVLPDMISAFAIETKIKEINPKFDCEKTVKDICDGYVYSWLIRRCLLCDSDFGMRNIGIIHNTKEGTIRLSPNYDFEWSFDMEESKKLETEAKLSTLEFVANNYPHVYEKFTKKLDKFYANGRKNSPCNQILTSVVGNDNVESKLFVKWFNAHQEKFIQTLPETTNVM